MSHITRHKEAREIKEYVEIHGCYPWDNQTQIETVPCQRCGEETEMTGTKLCDNCWELDRRFNFFKTKNPTEALSWLKEKLRGINGKQNKSSK